MVDVCQVCYKKEINFNYWIDESRVEQVAFPALQQNDHVCIIDGIVVARRRINFSSIAELLCFQTIHLIYRDCETSTLHWNYLWCCGYQKENIFSKWFPVWRTAFSLPGVCFEVPWSWKIDVDRPRKREMPRDVHLEWSCDMEMCIQNDHVIWRRSFFSCGGKRKLKME